MLSNGQQETEMQNVLIVAGEVSGDLLGAGLVKEFSKNKPEVKFFGFGGDRMSATGVELIYHIRQLAFMGFWEVAKNYRFIKNAQKQLLRTVAERKPSMAILIDYPGFNLRLAAKLKAMGVTVFYYVSPQIWAWGAGRIKKIKRDVDLMAVLFDFEKDIYDKAGVPAVWVGHPILDEIKIDNPESEFYLLNNLIKDDIVIGLLPGSRQNEVARLLPDMLKAAAMLKTSCPNLKPIIAKAESLDESLYQMICQQAGQSVPFFLGSNYELMAYSKICLVCSGTATLECGIIGTPLIVLYKTSFFTYMLARLLIKIKFIGLVNIVSGKSVVPELIQSGCNAADIARESLSFLNDSEKYLKTKSELAKIKDHLGNTGAARRVAIAAVDLFERINLRKAG
jgi:lipid-A-disaccharide synthase